MKSDNFPMLQVSIRCMNKNFPTLQSFLSSSGCSFEIELRLGVMKTATLFHIPNYKSMHQVRNI